jgi:hypothetical protein
MIFIRIDKDATPDPHSYYDAGTGYSGFKTKSEAYAALSRTYVLDRKDLEWLDKNIEITGYNGDTPIWGLKAGGLFGVRWNNESLTSAVAGLFEYWKPGRYLQVWDGIWFNDYNPLRKDAPTDGDLFMPIKMLACWEIPDNLRVYYGEIMDWMQYGTDYLTPPWKTASRLTEFLIEPLSASLGDPTNAAIFHLDETNFILVLDCFNKITKGEMGIFSTINAHTLMLLLDEIKNGFLETDDYGEVKYAYLNRYGGGGYGPYVYAAAMKLMPNGICPDQYKGDLSNEARAVWRRFYAQAQNDRTFRMTPIRPKKYPATPYRNYFYKINGPCIADPLIENALKIERELGIE